MINFKFCRQFHWFFRISQVPCWLPLRAAEVEYFPCEHCVVIVSNLLEELTQISYLIFHFFGYMHLSFQLLWKSSIHNSFFSWFNLVRILLNLGICLWIFKTHFLWWRFLHRSFLLQVFRVSMILKIVCFSLGFGSSRSRLKNVHSMALGCSYWLAFICSCPVCLGSLSSWTIC